MPIYEYLCNSCYRKLTKFWRSMSTKEQVYCPKCGSQDLTRLISRVSVVKSEESRLEALADPSSLAGLDENDPRSLAKWMKKMGKETGEELGPEFYEMADRLESGENPEEIERSLGGTDDEMPGMGGMGGLGGGPSTDYSELD
ncbi:MAG: zinc ribbon domain-containing protein [Candidatus Tectomicrobia bacterium]|uniref:Zinc ribbon domain-containing protein n=1 Tax=Tectimicrobiota bacterium TaxID=2528274 RepID=A0A933LR48_UNCTE|nr:zinc ribbon domain-containing protein [Candidatus Tectomicrobia bacterium]